MCFLVHISLLELRSSVFMVLQLRNIGVYFESVRLAEKVVGFRLGSYKNASVHVVSPSECVHIPQVMKDVAKVRNTKYY